MAENEYVAVVAVVAAITDKEQTIHSWMGPDGTDSCRFHTSSWPRVMARQPCSIVIEWMVSFVAIHGTHR
jgi:hypothetical protein